MNDSLHHSSSPSSHTALVLGGGGSAGNAWLIGVIAGLLDGGLDVTTADLIVGTSAGSTAAAQITAAPPAQLLADILSARPAEGAHTSSVRAAGTATPVKDYLEKTNAIIAGSRDAAEMRRKMGAAAIVAAGTTTSIPPRWRATVASRLPSQDWPDQRVLITAVNAATGDPVVFDRQSGVDLADAVAASCSNAVAYPIHDKSYIDGGYRSNADNADLATGYSRVLVLSPFGGRTRTPKEWGLHLETQVETLRATGSAVETVFPDADSRDAFGDYAMEPSSRPPAAQAGFEQGKSLSGQLAAFWR